MSVPVTPQVIRIRLGDCVEVLGELATGSIDAVICDPPYFLGFMGKEFDRQGGADSDPKKMQETHKAWLEQALRILKPGGLIVAMSGTRTFHRLGMAMEEAGFVEIDLEAWCYASGFPKSLNISKDLDRKQGLQREVVGTQSTQIGDYLKSKEGPGAGGNKPATKSRYTGKVLGGPCSDLARTYEGYGTALKPAWEPILVGRKPQGKKYDPKSYEGIPSWELF